MLRPASSRLRINDNDGSDDYDDDDDDELKYDSLNNNSVWHTKCAEKQTAEHSSLAQHDDDDDDDNYDNDGDDDDDDVDDDDDHDDDDDDDGGDDENDKDDDGGGGDNDDGDDYDNDDDNADDNDDGDDNQYATLSIAIFFPRMLMPVSSWQQSPRALRKYSKPNRVPRRPWRGYRCPLLRQQAERLNSKEKWRNRGKHCWVSLCYLKTVCPFCMLFSEELVGTLRYWRRYY